MEKCLTYYACDGSYIGANVDNTIDGYSGKCYVSGLYQDGDHVEMLADIPRDGFYHITLRYVENEQDKSVNFLIDDYCYHCIRLNRVNQFTEISVCYTNLKKGSHTFKFLKNWANNIHIDCLNIYPAKEKEFKQPSFELINPYASIECKMLMHYFKQIYGKKIISGQHTNLAMGKEFDYIHQFTGKYPAIRGFDLLSYSRATDTLEPSEGQIYETKYNRNTVEEIIKWVKEYKGIATICWHWYSPIRGKDKSFYTKFTDFDLEKALINGTPENIALLEDIDLIGKELLKLKALNIPILWRPLHEANGGWFWWGAKGAEAYKKLYRLMYHRYTDELKLNNLIWVWNAPNPDWYVGDDYCDIASIDIYNPNQNFGPSKGEFDNLSEIVKGKKPIALGENFPIPAPDILIESKTYWLFYMTWSSEDEKSFLNHNPLEHYKSVYEHPYLVTLEDLPDFSPAQTPLMGYNTFHDLGTNVDPDSSTAISEKYLMQVADHLVSSGMKDAGYTYVSIDDAWMAPDRDENGDIAADPLRFPNGMRALTDYIHAKGLKAGIYLTCGNVTYANLPGSLGYEQKDADKIAEWGFDLLKYDYRDDEAGGNAGRDSKKENESMRDALKNNKYGRTILFSLCQHGRQNVWEWGAYVGSMWRIATDVKDIWEGELDGGWSFNKIIDDVMVNISEYSGPGGWNDPDFLVAGHNQDWLGKDRKMEAFEQRTQFSLWCLLAAPLIHGYNPARNDAYAFETLMNMELIAVDQDSLGKSGKRIGHDVTNGLDIWVKPLSDGSYAVGLYNRSESSKEMTIKWSDLGIASEIYATVRDLWAHSDMGEYKESYTQKVTSHECAVLKITLSGL